MQPPTKRTRGRARLHDHVPSMAAGDLGQQLGAIYPVGPRLRISKIDGRPWPAVSVAVVSGSLSNDLLFLALTILSSQATGSSNFWAALLRSRP